MGNLRTRIARRKQIQKETLADNEYQTVIDNYIDKLSAADDRVELGPDADRYPSRQFAKRLREHAWWGYQAARQAEERSGVDGFAREALNFMTTVNDMTDAQIAGTLAPPHDEMVDDHHTWQADRSRDLRANFLFTEYKRGKGVNYRSFALYLDVIAVKAAIRLLTQTPAGEDTLTDRWDFPDSYSMPTREDALRFKESLTWESPYPEIVVEKAIMEIPGIYAAAHLLLEEYSIEALIEREVAEARGEDYMVTPLPHNHAEVARIDGNDNPVSSFIERRLESAVTGYATGEGNLQEVAQIYGVSRRKLRALLEERDLLRTRGGDVRQYRQQDEDESWH